MLSISTGNCGNQFACQTLSAIVEKGVAQMADDLKNRGAQDRSRVNVHEDHEVRYWTEKWRITKEQLVAAVGKAGVSVDAVAKELGKA
jgi:Protein of unknown function (DUF3606)